MTKSDAAKKNVLRFQEWLGLDKDGYEGKTLKTETIIEKNVTKK